MAAFVAWAASFVAQTWLLPPEAFSQLRDGLFAVSQFVAVPVPAVAVASSAYNGTKKRGQLTVATARRGLTLVEVLVSVAILVLLATLTRGVAAHAKREALRGRATSDG